MSSEKRTVMVNSGDINLHVVFLPYFMTSHMKPLVTIARLFAARGVRSTIITTVHNARTLQTSVDANAGHPITLQTLKFPASEVGVPIGIENISGCTTLEMSEAIQRGVMMLQKPMEQLIRDLAPDCIFSDMFFPWTADLADDLKIPRLIFYPTGFFYHSVFHSLKTNYDNESDDQSFFVVPNLPDKITMKRSAISSNFKCKTHLGKVMEAIKESENRSYGMVNNTFYEIEPAYVDHYQKISSPKIFPVGPLFQFFKHDSHIPISNSDSNSAPGLKHSCLIWLNDQKPKSVIYACFGSVVEFSDAQITEIALALEESKQPFIWVVKRQGEEETVSGLPEGFQERMEKEKKGVVVTEWAPQMEILQHPAVGGFLSHCGWNSVLEAVVNGVPLVTWPMFAEHFYTERLLVDVLGIGVGVGADVWNVNFVITSPVIKKESIVEAIRKLTDESESAESIRSNVKALSVKAKRAVEEGGSSYNNIAAMIQHIKAFNSNPK